MSAEAVASPDALQPGVVVHGVELPESTAKLVSFVNENTIGEDDTFVGPFGERKLTYVGA